MSVKEELYSVQAAAAMAGVLPGTLRMWEQRYDVVKPSRTEAGHRRYGLAAVERLKAIAALVRRGHAISTLATLPDDALSALLMEARHSGSDAGDPTSRGHVEALRDSIVRFDVTRAAAQLKWLRTVLGARAFVLEVAVPLFSTIGALVQESKLDISQEHALSAVLRDQIGDLLHTLQVLGPNESSGPPLVFASPEDDRHEFGILLGAVLAGVRGLPVWFGGADLPAKNLANAVKALNARNVILGNAPVPASERRVSFEQYLLDLDSQLPDAVSLRVGGGGDRPFNVLPSGRRIHFLNSLDELDAELENMTPGRASTPT